MQCFFLLVVVVVQTCVLRSCYPSKWGSGCSCAKGNWRCTKCAGHHCWNQVSLMSCWWLVLAIDMLCLHDATCLFMFCLEVWDLSLEAGKASRNIRQVWPSVACMKLWFNCMCLHILHVHDLFQGFAGMFTLWGQKSLWMLGTTKRNVAWFNWLNLHMQAQHWTVPWHVPDEHARYHAHANTTLRWANESKTGWNWLHGTCWCGSKAVAQPKSYKISQRKTSDEENACRTMALGWVARLICSYCACSKFYLVYILACAMVWLLQYSKYLRAMISNAWAWAAVNGKLFTHPINKAEYIEIELDVEKEKKTTRGSELTTTATFSLEDYINFVLPISCLFLNVFFDALCCASNSAGSQRKYLGRAGWSRTNDCRWNRWCNSTDWRPFGCSETGQHICVGTIVSVSYFCW